MSKKRFNVGSRVWVGPSDEFQGKIKAINHKTMVDGKLVTLYAVAFEGNPQKVPLSYKDEYDSGFEGYLNESIRHVFSD